MARITCPLCDKTFKNQSGLEWHWKHIHIETMAVGDGPGSLDVTMEQERSPGEGEYTNDESGDSEHEEQESLRDLKSRLERIESTAQDSQSRFIQLEARIDDLQVEIRGVLREQAELMDLGEKTKEIAAEIQEMRNQVESLCRLIYKLDWDLGTSAKAHYMFTMSPTKEEIGQARRVVKSVLGTIDLLAGGNVPRMQRQ